MQFLRKSLLKYLIHLFPLATAKTSPWQCRPGNVNLHSLYSQLQLSRTPSLTIGSGSDGHIHLSSQTTNHQGAQTVLKRFYPTSDITPAKVRLEYWIGHALSHINIAASHSLSFRQDNDSETVYWEIEMEYIDFPLLDLLDQDAWNTRPWGFQETKCLLYQIVDAVTYMHENGFAHRDIKVENVMVAGDGTVKMIDFGSVEVARNLLLGSALRSVENLVGTTITMAPEAYGERFYDLEKADVWAIGIIALRVLLGKYPWVPDEGIDGLDNDENFQRFVKENEDRTPCGADEGETRIICRVPEEMRSLLGGMLEIGPDDRFDLRTVAERLWKG